MWAGGDCGDNFHRFFCLLKTTQLVAIKYLKNMSAITIKSAGSDDEKSDWLEVVRRQVASLHYGVVQIVVHDSQVTQIEKTERVRLDKPRAQKV
jgi:hypothetical protein